jgi:beta-lactamase superfamily II metal-dependent hydrolase
MSKRFAPSLVVVDVGHGNAAVLNDTRGVVVFDTGKKGPALLEFLRESEIREIDALVLSHADDDHIGNAASLLLDPNFRVRRVLFNSDPIKGTDSQLQLQLAIRDARRHRGTRADSQLNTSVTGELDCGEVHVEVLFPPPELLVTGVGGRNASGRRNTSNSLSAAIRLNHKGRGAVLLAGDVGLDCLEFLGTESVAANAHVLVFPHHGGAPDGTQPARFAERITELATPKFVVFSIHRSRFGLPRKDVTDAILKASPTVKLLCTELPDRLIMEVRRGRGWDQHRSLKTGSTGWWDGHILISMGARCVRVGPYAKKGKGGRRTRP